MHYRMYVLIGRADIKTSQEARETVYDKLSDDDSFVGKGGMFNSPVADWFKIGGRWSGDLGIQLLDKATFAKFDAAYTKRGYDWIDSKHSQAKRKAQVTKLFFKYFPDYKPDKIGGVPYYRDSYQSNGCDDDAMIVSKAIYKRIIDPLTKDWPDVDDNGYRFNSNQYGDVAVIDLDGDVIDKSCVDHKWIVVVDYHN